MNIFPVQKIGNYWIAPSQITLSARGYMWDLWML